MYKNVNALKEKCKLKRIFDIGSDIIKVNVGGVWFDE